MMGQIYRMGTLGDFVRREREKNGWTQGELAQKIGVGYSHTIGSLETGRTKSLKTGNMRRLAEVLGVPFEELSGMVGKPSAPALPPLEQTPVTGRAVALRNQLTTRHITVKELAKRSGIAATVIDPMLRAAAPISDSMVNRLMDAMALIERERMLKIPEHEGVKPNGDKGSSRAAG
jgi:transcriptional regulator with XRE-family HTH domain